jgi:ribosomal protein S18 acetylase RimI-like enzyme
MIRPARPEDTPVLKQLTAATGVFKPHEVEALQVVLDDYHAGNTGDNHIAIVEEREGRIIGYAYYAPDIMTDRTWDLYWIAVDKTIQARGVGGRLLARCEADVRALHGRIVFIETSGLPHSDLTRKFYLKHGYTVAAVLRDFYADGDDKVVFRKRIEGSDEPR